MVIDDLDEVLSQAVDKHEREEAFSNDGIDEILSQSFDMFEEVKNSVENAIDIADMFEFGGLRFGYGSMCCWNCLHLHMKRCPKVSLLNAFYLKPLKKFKGKIVWYSNVPLGHNKLNSMVSASLNWNWLLFTE